MRIHLAKWGYRSSANRLTVFPNSSARYPLERASTAKLIIMTLETKRERIYTRYETLLGRNTQTGDKLAMGHLNDLRNTFESKEAFQVYINSKIDFNIKVK